MKTAAPFIVEHKRTMAGLTLGQLVAKSVSTQLKVLKTVRIVTIVSEIFLNLSLISV